MKIFDELTNKNFQFYASKYYDNKQCTSIEEFKDDMQRFKYLKRLFKRYSTAGDLQERLILNHLIIIRNVFGIDAAIKMLFFKVEEQHWPALKTFLVYLNYLREDLYVDVPLDVNIVRVLRGI
tara:strand:- start:163 stop:531 length:369 start_codon:yes stop_codon:yes gene_type:complete